MNALPRRSLRLQEAGYYTEEGTPTVNYKEILFKVFRRRHRNRRNPHNAARNEDFHDRDAMVADVLQQDDNRENGGESGSFLWTTCMGFFFVLMIFLMFGMAYELRNVKQELRALQELVYTGIPQVETIQNYALESQGARTLQHLSSDTYWPKHNAGYVWYRISHWWYSAMKQRQVIQGNSLLHPGECWPFEGEKGHLVIALSHPVFITHVTLSHITKGQSPGGTIASAPREFAIYGMRTLEDTGTFLGGQTYDQDGAAHQTFEMPTPDKDIFRYVKLRIISNWGNSDYTCLYGFRVHGKVPVAASEFP